MFVSLQHVVDRLRHPRSRADELAALRRKLGAPGATAEERALAEEIQALKLALAEKTGVMKVCASCAKGCPEPGGHWDGGHCCSGDTAEIFDEHELAALALVGATAGDFTAPRGDHAGCAFRGATGCSLSVARRANLCVVYVCSEASRELHAGGRLDEVEAIAAKLQERYRAFVHMRTERALESEGPP